MFLGSDLPPPILHFSSHFFQLKLLEITSLRVKWVRAAGINYAGILNALDVSACVYILTKYAYRVTFYIIRKANRSRNNLSTKLSSQSNY